MSRREFMITALMAPDSPDGLTLKPLYQMIDRRYATYWKYT